jgi:hypothetical protein
MSEDKICPLMSYRVPDEHGQIGTTLCDGDICQWWIDTTYRRDGSVKRDGNCALCVLALEVADELP